MNIILRILLFPILFPVICALTVCQWIIAFVVSIGNTIMYIIAAIALLSTVGCILLYGDSFYDLRFNLIGCATFIILPNIAMLLLSGLVLVKEMIKGFFFLA